jgi:hypothetical protein
MTKDQIGALLPAVMPTVRAWVDTNHSHKDAAAGDPAALARAASSLQPH